MSGLSIDANVIIALLVMVVIILLVVPGLRASRKVAQTDNLELLHTQLGKLADEIIRLQIKVDDQQRKLNDLSIQSASQTSTYKMQTANLMAIQKMLLENIKRLSAQVRSAGQEPSVDIDALSRLLA